MISEFSKVIGYKINKQKFITFLYTNNEHGETDIKSTIAFIMTTKKMKYFR